MQPAMQAAAVNNKIIWVAMQAFELALYYQVPGA